MKAMNEGRAFSACALRGGFTLVELLVVIAVIALLSAMFLPALGKAKESAYCAQCVSNQRQIGVSIMSFASDYSGYAPGSACYGSTGIGQRVAFLPSWESSTGTCSLARLEYIKNKNVYKCPSAMRMSSTLDASIYASFGWHMGFLYRFNGCLVGNRLNSDGLFGYFYKATDIPPQKLYSLAAPSKLAMMADAVCFADYADVGGALDSNYNASMSSSAIHRDRQTLNKAWADGHVTNVKSISGGKTPTNYEWPKGMSASSF